MKKNTEEVKVGRSRLVTKKEFLYILMSNYSTIQTNINYKIKILEENKIKEFAGEANNILKNFQDKYKGLDENIYIKSFKNIDMDIKKTLKEINDLKTKKMKEVNKDKYNNNYNCNIYLKDYIPKDLEFNEVYKKIMNEKSNSVRTINIDFTENFKYIQKNPLILFFGYLNNNENIYYQTLSLLLYSITISEANLNKNSFDDIYKIYNFYISLKPLILKKVNNVKLFEYNEWLNKINNIRNYIFNLSEIEKNKFINNIFKFFENNQLYSQKDKKANLDVMYCFYNLFLEIGDDFICSKITQKFCKNQDVICSIIQDYFYKDLTINNSEQFNKYLYLSKDLDQKILYQLLKNEKFLLEINKSDNIFKMLSKNKSFNIMNNTNVKINYLIKYELTSNLKAFNLIHKLYCFSIDNISDLEEVLINNIYHIYNNEDFKIIYFKNLNNILKTEQEKLLFSLNMLNKYNNEILKVYYITILFGKMFKLKELKLYFLLIYIQKTNKYNAENKNIEFNLISAKPLILDSDISKYYNLMFSVTKEENLINKEKEIFNLIENFIKINKILTENPKLREFDINSYSVSLARSLQKKYTIKNASQSDLAYRKTTYKQTDNGDVKKENIKTYFGLKLLTNYYINKLVEMLVNKHKVINENILDLLIDFNIDFSKLKIFNSFSINGILKNQKYLENEKLKKELIYSNQNTQFSEIVEI